MPIGNLSSQIFANIYLNELDQFIKHKLRVKYYFRYADDFVLLSPRQDDITVILDSIIVFLRDNLQLCLHSNKVSIRKLRQGIDFLGYVVRPYHKVLRTKTKNRMFKKVATAVNQFEVGLINQKSFIQTTQSYFGMLKHCNSYNLQEVLLDLICDKEYFERTGINVI